MQTINEKLIEIFGIPNDAQAATLRMRAGKPPVLIVMREIIKSSQLKPTRKFDKYRLVPLEKETVK